MASITVQMEPEALQQATQQAIMGMLTPEIREKLIADGIREMLKPSAYGTKRSALESAFANAIDSAANSICKELVAQDESLQTKLKALVREVSIKILDADMDKMATRMADSFVNSLRRD